MEEVFGFEGKWRGTDTMALGTSRLSVEGNRSGKDSEIHVGPGGSQRWGLLLPVAVKYQPDCRDSAYQDVQHDQRHATPPFR